MELSQEEQTYLLDGFEIKGSKTSGIGFFVSINSRSLYINGQNADLQAVVQDLDFLLQPLPPPPWGWALGRVWVRSMALSLQHSGSGLQELDPWLGTEFSRSGHHLLLHPAN